MMRIRINKSAWRQVEYFKNSLTQDDLYHSKECVGIWHGEMAKDFSLDGKEVTRSMFQKFSFNNNPKTGKTLTTRMAAERRTSIEYVFSAPKSFSIIQALTNDPDLLRMHNESVSKAMKAIEANMYTQVTVEGRKMYKKTGNIIYGQFTHLTSRPVKNKKNPGAPVIAEPGVHSHCIVMNCTAISDRYQAIEGSIVHRNASYYEAIYHSHLSKSLQALGYDILRSPARWEVNSPGLTRQTLLKFSNRTLEIESFAKKHGITSAKEKSEIGARTRLSKGKATPDVHLPEEWTKRLTNLELQAIKNAKGDIKESSNTITAEMAIEKALEHHLERKSTVEVKRFLAHAVSLGYGKLSMSDVKKAAKQRDDLLFARKNYLAYLSTKQMVNEEDKMLEYAVNGKGTLPPINAKHKITRDYLNKEQHSAIDHILNSTDRISIISGGAGVGKSTLLQEIREGSEKAGKRVFAFAPSAGASRDVLRGKGFKDADTLAKLLHDEDLHNLTKNQIILVDEAGMIGVKTMNKIFETSRKQNARIILSGDYRQHNAVEAGDALRYLEEKSKINVARVNTILRQKANPKYKRAIELLAKQETQQGFLQLQKMKAVIEIEDAKERHEQIARDYLLSVSAGRSSIVIAPTHVEGRMISEEIRNKFKNSGRIEPGQKSFTIQRNVNFTSAQKKDFVQYEKNMVVQFHQNVKGGFKAGEKYQVLGKLKNGHVVVNMPDTNKKMNLPLQSQKHFQVFRQDNIDVAKGDLIRITNNGRSLEKTRLNNGQIHEVKGFTKQGDIALSNGKTLGKSYGNFTHGYVQTSHAAQGKDCKDVFIAQSSLSFGASNEKQFYVSASRAKETICIYTDNTEALKEAICKSGDRMSAKEVSVRHKRREMKRQKILHYRETTKNESSYDRKKGEPKIDIQKQAGRGN